MRVAIVGCGQIARAHIGVLQQLPGIDLVAVCDRDEARAREAATWSPGSRTYTDFNIMLQSERPAAIHVLTPPATHAAIACGAMAAGCHVLVEKPMALGVDEADRMIVAARAHGVTLATNHNYRHKPSIRRAEALVAAGAIGRVVHVNAYYGVSGESAQLTGSGGNHWAYRLPGGLFTDYLPHLIYLQQAFQPGEFQVAGVAVGRDEACNAGELSVLLQGAGATGTMTVSLRGKPYAKFLDIHGTNGMVHADLVREICVLHPARRLPGMVAKVAYSLEASAQLAVGTLRNSANVALGRLPRMPELPVSIGQFYESLRRGQEPPASGEAGRRMVVVMEEIWRKAPELAGQRSASDEPAPRTEVERHIVREGKLTGKVLVTGANGYLGRHLVAALARCGAEVVAVVREKSRASRDLERQATLVEADLGDSAALTAAMGGVTTVFHCAAATRNNLPWRVHRATNVDGTRAVCAAAMQGGVGRLVHVSSIVVYGFAPPFGDGVVCESAPYADDDDQWAHYLRSKRDADALVSRLHRESGLPATIVRPGLICGPGSGRAVGRGLAQIGPVRLTIGVGRNALPFTYIDNLTDALLLAATSTAAAGQAYNIVDAPAVTVREYAACSASAAGERTVSLPVPSVLLSGVARVLEGRSMRARRDTPPRLSRFVVRSACSDLHIDTSKARRELGWQPAVPWQEGIRRALDGVE